MNPYKLTASGVDLFFGKKQVLKKVNFEVPDKQVVSLIGPSGCGKSTLLRCINRMNDLIDGVLCFLGIKKRVAP